MIAPGERVLVAVSGGKDSLALWDLLLELGYQADGLYIGLGIDGYSEPSAGYARRFAERPGRPADRGGPALGLRLRRPPAARPPSTGRRARPAGCPSGTSSTGPRSEGGYDVVATGHNLDDEAAVLLGNVLRWDLAFLARQRPVAARQGRLPPQGQAPGAPGRARDGRPTACCAGIDYQVEECPMAAGNKHLGYKDALNAIEERSPGTKAGLLRGFLERAAELVAHVGEEEREGLQPVPRRGCGARPRRRTCAFCRLGGRPVAGARRPSPVADTRWPMTRWPSRWRP